MDETLVVTTRFMTVGRLNYLKKLFQYLKPNQSEDCLYLNVFSRGSTTDSKLPVIFWIHGGAFNFGSGNDLLYGPGIQFTNI